MSFSKVSAVSATSLTIPHCVQVVLVLGSAGLVLLSPVQVSLQSQLPASPIEDPETWAWGLHPDNGLDYKARDSLSVEVCLANPELINTAKCSLPRDLCLSNAKFTPLVGCSGHSLPLSVCVSNPVLTTRDSCAGLDSLKNVSIKVNSYFRQQIPIWCVCEIPPVVQPTLMQGSAQCRYFQTRLAFNRDKVKNLDFLLFGMVFGFLYVYGSIDWGYQVDHHYYPDS